MVWLQAQVCIRISFRRRSEGRFMDTVGTGLGTRRLYLEDDNCFEAEAKILAVRENSLLFDQTCFYPGGGGQPPDDGSVTLQSAAVLAITSVVPSRDPVTNAQRINSLSTRTSRYPNARCNPRPSYSLCHVPGWSGNRFTG